MDKTKEYIKNYVHSLGNKELSESEWTLLDKVLEQCQPIKEDQLAYTDDNNLDIKDPNSQELNCMSGYLIDSDNNKDSVLNEALLFIISYQEQLDVLTIEPIIKFIENLPKEIVLILSKNLNKNRKVPQQDLFCIYMDIDNCIEKLIISLHIS